MARIDTSFPLLFDLNPCICVFSVAKTQMPESSDDIAHDPPLVMPGAKYLAIHLRANVCARNNRYFTSTSIRQANRQTQVGLST